MAWQGFAIMGRGREREKRERKKVKKSGRGDYERWEERGDQWEGDKVGVFEKGSGWHKKG